MFKMTVLTGGFKVRALIRVAVWSVSLVLCGCARGTASTVTQQQASSSESNSKSCLGAAKKALGPSAEVLKCGRLAGAEALEAVAAVRLRGVKDDANGVPISKLVILRRTAAHWIAELTMGQQIRNPVGYIGIDFIDDSETSGRYRVSFSDSRSDGSRGFTLYYYYMNPQDGVEGAGVEVSWNPRVQRFQAYSANEDPSGFKPEIKNPPHRKLNKCGGCKQPSSLDAVSPKTR